MPKKGDKKKLESQATAKVAAVAKATYQHKKTVTEVIPQDVTRAKAGAWLDLISPITEWAGLRGDALRHQRQQLRIQQEETLLRIAESVRLKMEGRNVSEPIPAKILVPALEKASLESPTDEVMIEKWAELLASAAQKLGVQPRFVNILEELAGSQAECLEYVAFGKAHEVSFPYRHFSDAPYEFAEHITRDDLRELTTNILGREKQVEKILEAIVDYVTSPGVFIQLIIVHVLKSKSDWADYDNVAETGVRRDDDLSILESLGLIRHVALDFELKGRRGQTSIHIQYYHLTHLGAAFCEVCSRSTISRLQDFGPNNKSPH